MPWAAPLLQVATRSDYKRGVPWSAVLEATGGSGAGGGAGDPAAAQPGRGRADLPVRVRVKVREFRSREPHGSLIFHQRVISCSSLFDMDSYL